MTASSEPAAPPVRIGSRTSDYDYELPESHIAQRPIEPRDASRLLVLDRRDGSLAHRTFRDVLELIPEGDAIVLNTTKVFRARLLGHRESGGPAEILLLRPAEGASDGLHFEAMIHPGGKLRPGRVVTIADDFKVEIVDTTPKRTRIVKLVSNGDAMAAVEMHGHVPLPPYIERADETGALRHGDRVEVGEAHARLTQRVLDDGHDVEDVRPARELGYYAAVATVDLDLRRDPARANAPTVLDHCSCGLVAARLNAEDEHYLKFSMTRRTSSAYLSVGAIRR
jgi:hypothetical protein